MSDKKPTKRQREILEHLAGGYRLVRWYMGERDLILIGPHGEWWGRVYGGMRHRLTANGWISRLQLTDAGREVVRDV